ncbi:non-ribosomal peptide synthetase [Amycolatopsis sp. H20-H5]|uniref:non-ribosomal peptide synthetase n=1 Tax=Amycolatopsis sp. H20-H5 TaxID=3046309 RepID=UPI002DBF58C0|nr:amino acid adenylation domain-containing protein [Amycolatopsis sp. H20-H5]MEC3979511.1 amino acid adenylation domain-containing protein [Amycolatopsis sp. H20-H5]
MTMPGDLPLSFSQERLWFLDALRPGGTEYLLPLTLRVRGDLDVRALSRSLDAFTARHEVLRTRYLGREGVPVQLVDEPAPVPLPVAEVREAEVDDVIARELSRAFDLATEPPLRARLLRLAAREHVLLVVVHHIAFDGASWDVLAAELRELYRAFTTGTEPELPALPVQYADFALWQREDAAARLDGQLAYWRERLAGLGPLELPADRPRGPVWDPAGAGTRVDVPAALADRLTALARSHRATPFMLLLAAYQVFLGRHTGGTDIAVGCPVAGRTLAEVENLAGFFVNTLVLRTDLAGDPSFGDLLDRVATTALDAFGNQEVPFDWLVGEFEPDRDLSRNPLVQAVFGLHEVPADRFSLPGLAVEESDVDWTASSFDLGLQFEHRPDGSLTGTLTYPTALFDPSTAARLAARFRRLLESIAENPANRLSELDLTPAAELGVLIDDWGSVPWPGEATGCFPELFARRVAAAPDSLAVLSGGRELTYAQLDARANRLARHLRAGGLGPESTVGVCVERGLDAVVALVGVLKSGAAYVPFDPSNPADRLALLVEDARTAAVLTQERFAGLFAGSGCPVIALDRDHAAIDAEHSGSPEWTVQPEHLAYVIYTSGSTGRPKGVQIQHGSYAEHALVIAGEYGITAADRVLSLASLAFDGSLEQLGAPLLAGASVLVSDPLFWEPEELANQLGKHRITSFNITPHYFRELLGVLAPGDPRAAHLKMMNVGADVVTTEDARRWRELGLPGRFVACYGPTEATISSFLHWAAEEDLTATTLPIGRPVPATSAYVLDPAGRPAPVGVPGELHLGGLRVARGYLRRPGLTADRFVPDPFSPTPGARLYRTGDLARFRADGTVEFLGRIDRQVKIRGFRIELGEIEAALTAHPAIRAAAVVAKDLPDRQLVAYVVPAPGGADLEALGTHLRAHLPEYLVPGLWVTLDALPLTPSKKVDRAALPDPELSRSTLAEPFAAPASAVERALAGIWSEVLRVEEIGAHDDAVDAQ